MGIGSEEQLGQEIFEVKRGKSVIFGGREGLPGKFLELSLNTAGHPRVRRLEGTNKVTIWGQDKTANSAWINLLLVQEIPDKLYERIDGGSVIIDVAVPRPNKPERFLRLNDAGGSQDLKRFRIEINPPTRDLRQS